MKLIESVIIALFLNSLVISAFSQEQPVDLGAVKIPYKTAKVPPNNGTWKFCSDTTTKYVSYSVRLVPDSTPITPGFGITTVGKSPSTLGIGKGFVTELVNFSSFVSSLSCYESIVMSCDQDTGKIPIKTPAKYCLLVTNPFSNSQTINVAFSGTDTVFEKGGFTSPNDSGGNDKLFNYNFIEHLFILCLLAQYYPSSFKFLIT
ncbi:hypothetical protein RclHR1_04240005 [Rhizophagus clarus]|uniref:Ubiquitin 3 binding protein But2 C-terminal domain-containing protein n=1 Tax=Rhizophagus clarus TaxID=94130 RepID=A0A2Z6RTI1_9GLOM|nr:hypothetical protein RclHR1_04240005 [Rhizophagus clarus]GET03439.1 hypothetical protein GLOIN_2v1872150 [Rhizophagus clarus]